MTNDSAFQEEILRALHRASFYDAIAHGVRSGPARKGVPHGRVGTRIVNDYAPERAPFPPSQRITKIQQL